MLKSILSSIILICISHGIWSQAAYAAPELETFVQIYMGEKSQRQTEPEQLQSLLAKYKISGERYSELFRAGLADEKSQLSENELAFTADLKKQNELVTDRRATWLQKECATLGLPYSDYVAILSRYTSEIKFQRSLQPHFENFLQKQK